MNPYIHNSLLNAEWRIFKHREAMQLSKLPSESVCFFDFGTIAGSDQGNTLQQWLRVDQPDNAGTPTGKTIKQRGPSRRPKFSGKRRWLSHQLAKAKAPGINGSIHWTPCNCAVQFPDQTRLMSKILNNVEQLSFGHLWTFVKK